MYSLDDVLALLADFADQKDGIGFWGCVNVCMWLLRAGVSLQLTWAEIHRVYVVTNKIDSRRTPVRGKRGGLFVVVVGDAAVPVS